MTGDVAQVIEHLARGHEFKFQYFKKIYTKCSLDQKSLRLTITDIQEKDKHLN
jgi:hypothetical protein